MSCAVDEGCSSCTSDDAVVEHSRLLPGCQRDACTVSFVLAAALWSQALPFGGGHLSRPGVGQLPVLLPGTPLIRWAFPLVWLALRDAFSWELLAMHPG